MSIRIDEMTSDVELEPELPPGGPPPIGSAPTELERLRRSRAELAMIERRTCAEGYDD